MKEKQYIVAIKCRVYNHEPYLRDCLNGFVMQKTNFPFIAIVHDDASTDKSADIIREYADKYPEIIHPIYETENQYSKHDGSLNRIMNEAAEATNAKYIAACEGDDYWTDSLKLQKQVDFMEGHPDYSMCFHGADVKNETNAAVHLHAQQLEYRQYTVSDILNDWIVPTASILYKKDALASIHMAHKEWLTRGDVALVLSGLKAGKLWGMSDVMSVYRMQPHGASKDPSHLAKEKMKLPNYYKCLYINFHDLDKENILKMQLSAAFYSRARVQKKIVSMVWDMLCCLRWSPSLFFSKLSKAISSSK